MVLEEYLSVPSMLPFISIIMRTFPTYKESDCLPLIILSFLLWSSCILCHCHPCIRLYFSAKLLCVYQSSNPVAVRSDAAENLPFILQEYFPRRFALMLSAHFAGRKIIPHRSGTGPKVGKSKLNKVKYELQQIEITCGKHRSHKDETQLNESTFCLIVATQWLL